jgi:hypothetical protein
MRRSRNRPKIEAAGPSVSADHWQGVIMSYARTGPSCYRPRTATSFLSVGIIVIASNLLATDATSSVLSSIESPVARGCAEWASQKFYAHSPARDEAFIDCIIKRDPSVTADELRRRLATGDGDGLFSRLMTGQIRPITHDPDCPYLRVAVQSPVGSDEVYQRPMRELFSTALKRAGFQVVDTEAAHHWWASSLTLDTGADSAAWTILVRAVPEIGDGAIQFTNIRKTVNGREEAFSGMQSLRSFAKDEAPIAAALAAERIAEELLPAAQRRCGDIDATLEEAQMRLEQLRNELTEEIERVRMEKDQRERERAGGQKLLKIEVEG